jgi:eukaryotic-like serine/threonine-protein kinase
VDFPRDTAAWRLQNLDDEEVRFSMLSSDEPATIPRCEPTWLSPSQGLFQPDPASEAQELPIGTQIGEYIVESSIDAGGCGSVYLACHSPTSRPAAIKVLHGYLANTPKLLTRFMREIEIIKLLGHPNIVAIEDAGQLEDGRPYYVMEYLGTSTILSILREQGSLSVADCLALLEPVCSALSAAHAAGVVHRDIKASNISVRFDDDRCIVKLLDFGVAKLIHGDAEGTGFTTRGRLIGTLTAMAPEQIRGEQLDARTDVYALGALLYRMLTGKQLFPYTEVVELIWRHLEEPAPRPSLWCAVSPEVDAVVLRCLEKDPARRFDSAQSFIDALRRAQCQTDAQNAGKQVESVDAVGVLVDFCLMTDESQLDETLDADIQRTFDAAEEALRNAGFSIALATGNALLGVRELPADPRAMWRERQRALDFAASLRDKVDARPDADKRLDVVVRFRTDEALITRAPCFEVVGGPLVRTEEWASKTEAQALRDLVQTMR